MGDRSLTAYSAVAALVLMAVSVLAWGELGAVGLNLMKSWAGGG